MSTSPANAASFLGIALETRLQIYEELLEESNPFPAYTDFLKYRVPFNLLLVNKQIRGEAEPVLFRNNALSHHVYALPVHKDADDIKESNEVKDSHENEDSHDIKESNDVKDSHENEDSHDIKDSYNFEGYYEDEDCYDIEDFPFAALCPSLRTVHLRLVVPASFDTGLAPDMLMATLAARMRKTCEVLPNVPALRTVEVSILGGDALRFYDFNVVGVTAWSQEKRLMKLFSRFAYMLLELKNLPTTVDVKRGYIVFYKYHDRVVGDGGHVRSPVNDNFSKCLNEIMALRSA